MLYVSFSIDFIHLIETRTHWDPIPIIVDCPISFQSYDQMLFPVRNLFIATIQQRFQSDNDVVENEGMIRTEGPRVRKLARDKEKNFDSIECIKQEQQHPITSSSSSSLNADHKTIQFNSFCLHKSPILNLLL